MKTGETYLTKTRYIDGLRCSKKLWLGWHEPSLRKDPEPFSPLDVGNRIGAKAHLLFPGGVRVEEEAYQHEEAVETTKALVNDPSIPAIFEAAFDYDDVRIRVDVLERLSDHAWGIREVKSSGTVSSDKGHYDDVAVQLYVVEGAGLAVSSVELIHVNRGYTREDGEIDWPSFFSRADLTEAARNRLAGIGRDIPQMQLILNQATTPEIFATKALCGAPYRCEFWGQCMAAKPDDWVGHLPRIGKSLEVLHHRGVDSIRKIPDNFELSDTQAMIRQSIISGKPKVLPGLPMALQGFGPPAYYLDFETMMPAIPAYPQTKPYERIAFQWSLHLMGQDGAISHQEFLASGDEDPRREVAESLIAAVSIPDIPIVVYHETTEKGILQSLEKKLPNLAESLSSIRGRVVDLHPIVRDHIVHPGFFTANALESSAYSIKNVLPVLVPGEDHKNLVGVSKGLDASQTFEAIIHGVHDNEKEEALRQELREYCKKDTSGMVDIQKVLQNSSQPDSALQH